MNYFRNNNFNFGVNRDIIIKREIYKFDKFDNFLRSNYQIEVRYTAFFFLIFVDLSIFINHSIFFFLTSSMIDSWLKFLSVIFWTRFKRYVHRINFSVGKNDGNRWKKRVAWKFYTKIFHSRISRASLSRKIILQMIKKRRWSFWLK